MRNIHPQILNHLRAKHDVGSDNITHAHAERPMDTPGGSESDDHETEAETTEQSKVEHVKHRLWHLGLHASGVHEPPKESPPHE
jgi:hypothetical protein